MITAVFPYDTPSHPERLSANTWEGLEQALIGHEWLPGPRSPVGQAEKRLRASTKFIRLLIDPSKTAPPLDNGFASEGVKHPPTPRPDHPGGGGAMDPAKGLSTLPTRAEVHEAWPEGSLEREGARRY